jgi:hypothetical protein
VVRSASCRDSSDRRGIAAVTRFGIASVLTPVLALQVSAKPALAAVPVPHLMGTALRFWLLGGRADWIVWRPSASSRGCYSEAGYWCEFPKEAFVALSP